MGGVSHIHSSVHRGSWATGCGCLQEARLAELQGALERARADIQELQGQHSTAESSASEWQTKVQALQKQVQEAESARDTAQGGERGAKEAAAAAAREWEEERRALEAARDEALANGVAAAGDTADELSRLRRDLEAAGAARDAAQSQAQEAEASASRAAKEHAEQASRWESDRRSWANARKQWEEREALLLARLREAADNADADAECAALQRQLAELKRSAEVARADAASEAKSLRDKVEMLQARAAEKEASHLQASERLKRRLREALQQAHDALERYDLEKGDLSAKLRAAEAEVKRQAAIIERLKQQVRAVPWAGPGFPPSSCLRHAWSPTPARDQGADAGQGNREARITD